jgi:hypothetical protein
VESHFENQKDVHVLVCIPSGEVFYANGLQLYNLFENELIDFEPFKEFWYFYEIDIDRIRLITK